MRSIRFLLLVLVLSLIATGARAQIVVTSTGDSGTGSLRDAIASASDGTTITFDPSLSGQTIYLTSDELLLAHNLTIDASALANGISINGSGLYRIFEVAGGETVVLTALTLTNGYYLGNGGGIYNSGTLTVNQCTLAGNYSEAGNYGGGGIYSEGTLTLNECTLFGNHADDSPFGGGGAILTIGVMTVNQSTLVGNHADNSTFGGGGGIVNGYNGMTLFNSIIAENIGTPGADIENFGALDEEGTNLIQNYDDTVGGGSVSVSGYIIDADPMLAPLGNYGGPTPTMPPLSGSPAVDAGSDSAISLFTTDQRGDPRLSGLHVDIGADELQVAGITATNSPVLTGILTLSGGNPVFQLSFTNLTGASFTVFASTNLAAPLSTWSIAGFAVESPSGSGQFQFTDLQATNYTQRFYSVHSP